MGYKLAYIRPRKFYNDTAMMWMHIRHHTVLYWCAEQTWPDLEACNASFRTFIFSSEE